MKREIKQCLTDDCTTAAAAKGVCKRCYMKRWKEANPERWSKTRKDSRLRTLYGIERAEYEALLVQQSGRCAICEATEGWKSSTGRSLSVDHDHATGRIRGLLCHNCNRALGLLGDTSERLRKVLAYLEANGS